jgi:hypothetical protein
MALDEDDYALSMAVSPRARQEENNLDLRSMLVHRLSDTAKAIWRRGLRSDNTSAYCEHCRHWTRNVGIAQPLWTCARCARVYRIEFVIYEEVDP